MFLSKKVENSLVLILDVQSSVVHGSLVLMSATALPRIIFTHSVNLAYKTNDDDSFLIKTTLLGIKEIIQVSQHHLHAGHHFGVHSDLPRKISAIHYVLSTPWIVSEAKVLSKQFTKETTITKKYITDLIEADQSKIVSSPTDPIQVIEQKIFDVRLNGYSVAEWDSKQARSLDVSFTVSIAGTGMIERFIDECRHVVHTGKIQFHSSLLLQNIGIERILNPNKDYCLIHVHGDETDVSIIREKTCAFFGSFHFGVRTMISKIETSTNNHRQAADSLLSLYTGGKLDDSLSKKDLEAILKITEDWAKELKALFEESKNEIKQPMTIMLTAWAHDECFVEILNKIYPGIKVSLLSIDDLVKGVTFDASTEKMRLIALHAIAIHSLQSVEMC